MNDLRRTPFYDLQKERGARFVPFGGWELPVQYEGLIAEHQTVRERVGLFDVSHMGEVVVEGPGALDAVQYLVTNDVARLSPGKAFYTVMCLDHGGIVDDLIVYMESTTRFFLCINASRRDNDVAHITATLARFDCRVIDVSDSYAQLALQGPRAKALLQSLCTADVSSMDSFTWQDAQVAGISGVRIARTGYTGEHGYELYCSPRDGAALWLAIEGAGRDHGLGFCGLGARDTLRLEMKYPLYGNDIDDAHNPLEAGLGWVVKLKKGDFLGRAALEQAKARGLTRQWVGFKMRGRGIPRHGYPIAVDGREVGSVTSGTHSPSLGEPIGTGYVPTSHAKPGARLHVIIRDKPVEAEVVETPFYQKED